MIVYQPADAFLHRLARKVQQQPYGLTGQTQVGEQLLGMGTAVPLRRFDLDDQPLIDKQVDPERRGERKPIEMDIDRLLPINPVSGAFERASQNQARTNS